MAKKVRFDEGLRGNELIAGINTDHDAWHAADDGQKKVLHQNNVERYKELDPIWGGKSTFNPTEGTWSTDFGDGNVIRWNNGVTGAGGKRVENAGYNPSTADAVPLPLHKGGYSSTADAGRYPYGEGGYNDNGLGERINALYELAMGRRFKYDPETDPSYQAYKKAYLREGDRAVKSTLADVATAQGGMSSYAGTAAQQAGNYYAQKVTDKIPELEALAYQKFMADRDNDWRGIDYLIGRDDRDYQRYADERDFGYGVYRDQIADRRYDDETAYEHGRDAIADARDERDFNENVRLNDRDYEFAVEGRDYGRKKDEDETYYNRLQAEKAEPLNMIDWYLDHGIIPPDKYLNAVGMTADDARSIINRMLYGTDVNFNNGGGSAGGSSAGSSGGSGRKSSSKKSSGKKSSGKSSGSGSTSNTVKSSASTNTQEDIKADRAAQLLAMYKAGILTRNEYEVRMENL